MLALQRVSKVAKINYNMLQPAQPSAEDAVIDIVSRSSRYASHDGHSGSAGKPWHSGGGIKLRKSHISCQTEEEETMSHLSVQPPAVEAKAYQ